MAKLITKSSLLQLPHIQRTHKWDLEILRRPSIPFIINETIFRNVIKSAEVPKYTVETAEFNKQGMKWEEEVNVLTNGDWSFTAYELESAPLRNLMSAWQKAMLSGTVNRREATADLKLTSKDVRGRNTKVYILKFWYPVDVEIPEFSSDAALMETTVSGKYMDLDIQ